MKEQDFSKKEVYKYIAENERERYIFYFSFPMSEAMFYSIIIMEIGSEVSFFDCFPEPNIEEITLEEDLSIRNKAGSEVIITKGSKVKIISTIRVLFYKDD
tara:strand:- start:7739 stop:8041 length:303 start_codon:yes stop_codon:yes gene_type:complete